VQHAHDRGILHRDLKPANVLIAPLASATSVDGTSGIFHRQEMAEVLDFAPKISDFGLAKVLAVEHDSSAVGTPTLSGAILGTPNYMAPEQADGRVHELGPAVDIHALGAILYQVLTGRPPFRGATTLDLLLEVRHAEPTPPSRLAPRIPRDLETICLTCLAKEPRRRYASALRLAEDLDRFLAGEPILARPTRALPRAWRWLQAQSHRCQLGRS